MKPKDSLLFYQETLDRIVHGEMPVDLLPQDGSDRTFFRVQLPEPSPVATAIVVRGAKRGYVRKAQQLREAGIPVPQIYAANPTLHFVLEEDFGDLHLFQIPAKDMAKFYEKALAALIQIQEKFPSAFPFQPSLNAEALYQELVFFLHHFLLELQECKLTGESGANLKKEFRKLARACTALPLKMAHRDYHSRNILVKEDGELGIVDFQDARLAPFHYDLASLLRDAYRPLPETLEEELLDRFHNHHHAPPSSRSIYWNTVCQRSLKALGSFAYLGQQKKKGHFFDFIPQAQANVQKCFEFNPELGSLRRALAPLVSSWR